MQKHGFKKPKYDPRRFSWKKKFGAARILPTEDFLVFGPLEIKDQGQTNTCTACTVASVVEAQFGHIMDECFQYAASKAIEGRIDDGGVDPDIACKAVINYGALLKESSPFKMKETPILKLANIANYPQEIQIQAKTHREYSFYEVECTFDGIRSAMIQSRESGFPTPIMVGTRWRFLWNSMSIIKGDSGAYGYHEFAIIGQKNINGVLYLVALNSYGKSFGDGGLCYFPKELVDKFMFARAFAPGNKEDEKVKQWNFLQMLYDKLYSLIKDFMTQTNKQPDFTPAKEVSKFEWDTKAKARHSCRVVMDEFNLSWANKDLLCAVIQSESAFNPNATHKNNDGSTDYGICQINNKFWIGAGKYFADADEVLRLPEKSVRFMCEQFKAGNLKYWYGYTNGSYKKFL